MGDSPKFISIRFMAGGIFTLVVLFIGIFFEPMKLWLEMKLWSPEIKIEFQQEPPFFFLNSLGVKKVDKPVFGVPFTHEKVYRIYFCRFTIKNESSYRTVHNCRVKLTDIWHVDKAGNEVKENRFEPVELEWTGKVPVDLQPKAKIFGYLVKVSDVDYQKIYEIKLSGDSEQPQLRLMFPGDIPHWMPSHLDPGKHRLSVTIFFDDRRPVNQIFEVEWSGNWQEDEELMKNELQIKKID